MLKTSLLSTINYKTLFILYYFTLLMTYQRLNFTRQSIGCYSSHPSVNAAFTTSVINIVMQMTINFLEIRDLMLTSFCPIKFNRNLQPQALRKNCSHREFSFLENKFLTFHDKKFVKETNAMSMASASNSELVICYNLSSLTKSDTAEVINYIRNYYKMRKWKKKNSRIQLKRNQSHQKQDNGKLAVLVGDFYLSSKNRIFRHC